MNLLILLSILGSTGWVATDASKRDWSTNSFASAPWKWVVGMLLLWIVALPAYLLQRGRVPLKGAPAGGLGAPTPPSDTVDASRSVPPPGFGG